MATYATDRGYAKRISVELPPDLLKYVLTKAGSFSSPGEYIKKVLQSERLREEHFKNTFHKNKAGDI